MGVLKMEIRRMNINDYDSAYELWGRCGFELGKSDRREEIEKFIEKNPDTCLVGILDNKIIGSVLGGYDGRRGLVHHLSVYGEYRKMGYGKALIEALENEFKKAGVVKMSFWVKTDNFSVVDFYKACGYELREDIITMSKSL